MCSGVTEAACRIAVPLTSGNALFSLVSNEACQRRGRPVVPRERDEPGVRGLGR